MKNAVLLAALLVLSFGAFFAEAATNFEYSNPSPFYPGQPAQPNLAQVHLTKPLHDTLRTYIAFPSTKTKIVVAILDGYADTRHVDLSGRETVVKVYAGIYGYDPHGTHVSGIVGAAKNDIGIVGVNPFATLINIPVFDRRGWVATDLGKKALDRAVSLGARVVNMSYGPGTAGDVFMTGELNLFRNYNSSMAGKGMVLVRAAGNSGAYVLNEAFSGNAAVDLGNLLIVGSVNGANTRSTFSNAPGGACIGGTKSVCTAADSNAMMNFWLMAPGENILSDLPNNYVGLMSGTSMAAPHVAGAAGLVFQKALAGNTLLTPSQVAQILKLSADDLGAPGVDAIYGWGLLDVAAALNPIGSTSFPTGSTVNSGLVVTQTSTVSSSSMLKTSNLAGALSGIIVLDDFARAFVIDEPHLFSNRTVPQTTFVDGLMSDLSAMTVTVDLPDQARLSLTSSGGGARVLSFAGRYLRYDVGLHTPGSHLAFAGADAVGVAESMSRRMAQEFYAGAGEAAEAFDRAMVFGWDLRTSARVTLSGLYLHTAPGAEMETPGLATQIVAERDRPQSSLMKIGANYRVSDSTQAGIYAGYLEESDHTLGMRTGGAFALGDGVTYLTGVTIRAAIAPQTVLSTFAERSMTVSESAANSLFTADTWTGSKYGASLTQLNPFDLGGTMRLKLVRSWQIDDGSLTVRLPVGRELDGTVNYEMRRASIASDTTPLEVGLAYLAGDDRLKYGAELRLLKGTSSTPENDGRLTLAIGVRWGF